MGMNAVGTSMAVVSRPAGVFSATSNRSIITTLCLVGLAACHFPVGIIKQAGLARQAMVARLDGRISNRACSNREPVLVPALI
jgi:hypothetical protein